MDEPLAPPPLTFLFTDVEGSTRRWEEDPAAMRVALARHDDLLHTVITAQGGTVFKTVGDAFYAVFAAAEAAVAAAVAAQHRLLAEPGAAPGPLRVRMALHTGPAEARAGDYFGPSLNRVARLLVAGHGGQILLTLATQQALGPDLPAGLQVHDLGARRLKDLIAPERIFQLIAPGLPAEFPPLRSLEAFQHNLPVQLTSFVGRPQEIAAVTQLLGTTHLLTLTGPGGTGKTRLSLQVAADLVDRFADGAWLVELAPLADPVLVPQAVAAALGVREEPERPLLSTLANYLRAKELLLILDNCEHLVDAAARLVSGLLPGCPQLRILASSREALGIAGEIPFRVPSLAVPAVDEAVPVDRLHEYAAIHLFLERVALVQPRFTLTAANAAATVQICRRLDGIPLALELAAARVPVLGVQGVAARLDDRFRLLTGGSRTALPRQQTLRALIDWSWDLLNADERALLRRLAVFAGSWSLDAAEAVAGGESVLDTLAALANKSLVMVESAADPPRYRLLETIRQYARERLLAAGEAEAWRDRHLVYYLDLAERTAPHLASPDHTAAFARLDAEHENLRAALAWAQEHDALAELRLAGALGRFWQRGGHWHEARGWVEDALARPEAAAHTAARARALLLAGTLAGNQDEPVLARTRLEESVALSRELGDRSGLAWALSFLCRNTWPDDPAAWALGEESIALFRALGDRWGLAATLAQLASLAHVFYHDLAAATAMSEESLALFRALGDAGSTALPLGNLARHAYDRGDYATARTQFEEVLALLRAGGGKPALAGILLLLGEVARSEDDYARAEPIYAESLALYQAIGSRLQAAMVLVNLAAAALAQGAVAAAAARLRAVLPLVDGLEPARLRDGISTVVLGYLGIVATLQGQPARAARLFACVAVRRELIAPVASRADHAEFARYQAIAQGQLDAAAWASAWAAGEALALPDALAYALAPPDPA